MIRQETRENKIVLSFKKSGFVKAGEGYSHTSGISKGIVSPSLGKALCNNL